MLLDRTLKKIFRREGKCPAATPQNAKDASAHLPILLHPYLKQEMNGVDFSQRQILLLMHQWLSAAAAATSPFYLGFYGNPITTTLTTNHQYSHSASKKESGLTIFAHALLCCQACISINQQRHGKGISTFAVQSELAEPLHSHTPKSGHITCIPDFYFITANKSKAGMVISELIKNMVFCIIIIILFMCVCSEGSQPQTSGGHALKLKALVS